MVLVALCLAAPAGAADGPPAAAARPVPAEPAVQGAPLQEPVLPLVARQERFARLMTQVRQAVTRLRQPQMSAASLVDELLAAKPEERGGVFLRMLGIVQQRLAVATALQRDLAEARQVYGSLAGSAAAQAEELRQLTAAMDEDLTRITQDLDAQAERLAQRLNAGKLELFGDFAKEKAQLVSTFRTQLQARDLPNLDAYFDQFELMVQTGMTADKLQLVNLQYVATAMKVREAQGAVAKALGEAQMTDYLGNLGDQELDTQALLAVLNHTSASAVAGSFAARAPAAAPAAPASADPAALLAEFAPERGPGGVYHYGETVNFLVAASRDCSFLLLYTDQEGQTRQVLPSIYAPEANRLEGGRTTLLPGDGKLRLEACAPAGVARVTLLVTPTPASAPTPATATLVAQPRNTPELAANLHRGRLRQDAPGNALRLETFVVVKP